MRRPTSSNRLVIPAIAASCAFFGHQYVTYQSGSVQVARRAPAGMVSSDLRRYWSIVRRPWATPSTKEREPVAEANRRTRRFRTVSRPQEQVPPQRQKRPFPRIDPRESTVQRETTVARASSVRRESTAELKRRRPNRQDVSSRVARAAQSTAQSATRGESLRPRASLSPLPPSPTIPPGVAAGAVFPLVEHHLHPHACYECQCPCGFLLYLADY